MNSVVLPAHAITSVCNVFSLAGKWRFTSATHIVPAYYPDLELYQDGSTSDAASEWSISKGVLILRQDISDYIFRAKLTPECNHLSGTSTTAFTFPPYNQPENGTWSAEKI